MSLATATGRSAEVSEKPAAAFVAYIPVLHNGYVQLFAKRPEIDRLFLLTSQLFPDDRSLVKDLRAVPTELLVAQLQLLEQFDETDQIVVLDSPDALRQAWPELSSSKLIMPDEELNHRLVEEVLPTVLDVPADPTVHEESKKMADLDIEWLPLFLRWERRKLTQTLEVHPVETVSRALFDRQVMRQLSDQAEQSLDWWRQVAAAYLREGEVVLTARNQHLPFDQQAYVDGDPRANFSSGEEIELASSIHAEALLVARAAERGLSMKGGAVYVTTFPCPVCAKLLSQTGIETLYYQDGYSLLHGQEILEQAGVKLVRVMESDD